MEIGYANLSPVGRAIICQENGPPKMTGMGQVDGVSHDSIVVLYGRGAKVGLRHQETFAAAMTFRHSFVMLKGKPSIWSRGNQRLSYQISNLLVRDGGNSPVFLVSVSMR